ncbi:MAG: PEGA domain-containing protein [Phycisphaerae bacterium]|nr:PEGA domain-containing protein [Phycisphaerae bacterium]NUQ44954.1 PEGA domain-containing protein [Phycisphaerae bacterium]
MDVNASVTTTQRPTTVKPPFNVVLPAVLSLSLCACIERTLTIRTEPEGARVHLNDQDVGRSPVTVPFTWYGDYDVVIRKEGFETLRTNHRLNTPWYELPGIDLVTECLIPFTVRDHHDFPVYALTPRTLPEQDDVVLRAEEMRERALFAKD